ncbi:MAG: hypothetical protein CL823_00415 [Crocinitomicaceae bacterium]|nr:hypothetical protein [Crocinitomicaceae bacterium]|tara:strand:+ start:2493 stop:3269 length:777 start_codon:yes stop_codon:yes gene_type:complete
MKERGVIRFAVLVFWTFFWGLSVVDKIIPDVHYLWVGKDFFALFIKFFASLGFADSIFATIALAGISALEVLNFVFYLFAIYNFFKGDYLLVKKWFFRAVFSSMTLFALFSIGDQVFGDRFQLLEHGLFWLVLIASWVVFKYGLGERDFSIGWSKDLKLAIAIGLIITLGASFSIRDFSKTTFSNVDSPVSWIQVEGVEGLYKFDFPFLADKLVWEKTINTFKEENQDLKINYIYTGPGELNSKKKTHMLLYVFTEKK